MEAYQDLLGAEMGLGKQWVSADFLVVLMLSILIREIRHTMCLLFVR